MLWSRLRFYNVFRLPFYTSVEVSEEHSWFSELTLYVSLSILERGWNEMTSVAPAWVCSIHFAFHLSSLFGLFKLGQSNLFDCGRNLKFPLGLLNVENFCR